MNYWPRWINAIKKRTASLSLAEMGAYDRLLDHYYSEETPLPADLDECCRLTSAITKDERRAVERVLNRYFVLGPDGYRNERADEEIALALPKIAAAQANGRRGGRPKGPEKKPIGFPPGTHGEPGSKAPHPHPQRTTSSEEHQDAGGRAGAGAVGGLEPPDQPIAEAPPDTDSAVLGGVNPTTAGLLCRTLRQHGIADVNPGHPRLLALLDAGAQESEFVGFVKQAMTTAPGKAFAYLLGAVEGERKRAVVNANSMYRGPMPNKQEALEQRNRAVGRSWAEKLSAAGARNAGE